MANGHVKLHRAITNSSIYTQPPLYLRVFERLILEANWKCERIPFNKTMLLVKRGERVTSIRQIAEWVGWYERGILKQPNPKTIAEIITWLVNHQMIEMVNRGNAQVTHYNVLNYCDYQSVDDAKVTVAGEVSKQQLDTNNNINNLNKVNKLIDNDSSIEESIPAKPKKSTAFTPPSIDEVAAYCRERNNTVDAAYWCDFYESKDWMIGKNKMKNWKAAVRTWEKNSSAATSVTDGLRRI